MSDSGKWPNEKTVNVLPALCEQLRQRDPVRPGAWRLLEGDRPVGLVLMEGGRVCWALSQGLEQRLTDLLVEQQGLARSLVETIYRDCRERRLTLAEGFVARGALSRQAFERVMMQHTAEAFRGLARLRPTDAQWLPHRRGGYEPSVSFAVGRVLAHAVCLSSGVDAEALERELAAGVGERDWAVAFGRESSLPLGVVGEPPGGVDELLDLGRWAHGAFGTATQAGLSPRALTASMSGGTLMAAEQCERIVVTWSQEPTALARFFSRHARGNNGYLRPK